MANLVLWGGKAYYSAHGVLLKPWPIYIRNRVRFKKKNFLGFFSGETGSGKSWSSLSVADDTDLKGEFNEEKMYFSIEKFVKDVKDKKLKRGNSCVVEEVGTEANSREWRSINNKAIFYLTQTFRKRGIITYFNAPSWSFFDSGTRKLLHAVFSTEKVDMENSECVVRALRLQYNDLMDKIYWHHLRIATGQGSVPIAMWKIPKPRKALIIPYEKMKDEFMDKKAETIDALLHPKSKKEVEQYPHHCPKCKYNWISQKKVTKKCPMCQKRLISLANGVFGDINTSTANTSPI